RIVEGSPGSHVELPALGWSAPAPRSHDGQGALRDVCQQRKPLWRARRVVGDLEQRGLESRGTAAAVPQLNLTACIRLQRRAGARVASFGEEIGVEARDADARYDQWS